MKKTAITVGHYDVFRERMRRLYRAVGECWDRPESRRLIPWFASPMCFGVAKLGQSLENFPSLNAFFARPVPLARRQFDSTAALLKPCYGH